MMVAKILDPLALAKQFRDALRSQVMSIKEPIKLVGFLPQSTGPSLTYAQYTQAGCDDVRFSFDLRRPSRLRLESEIEKANQDSTVHGIIIYYPVFNNAQDAYLKDLIAPEKDIEGLSSFWIKRLYRNERLVPLLPTSGLGVAGDQQHEKAILPCTPLAIVKLLEHTDLYQQKARSPESQLTGSQILRPLEGKTVTVFNRSEVVGRPLASMLHHDGATVYSFDALGPIELGPEGPQETSISREDALMASDLVITGVPSRDFPLIEARDIRPGTICLNFSTYRNFSEDIIDKASFFVPRVGPMTVTMALRNTLRLYQSFHRFGRRIGALA
jgi:methylenetetrahydrofolate dehydrogenase (NADP+)/methenyltetrahydrofolate cyclohydrolase